MGAALRALVGTVFAGALVATVAYRSRASDHDDYSPGANEPATDIADVFAFMKPSPLADGGPSVSDRLVLMMTVHPRVDAGATFDPKAELIFLLAGVEQPVTRGVIDHALDVSVSCRFQDAVDGGGQPFVCAANGFFFAGTTNVVSGDDAAPLRVFAGRRADPAYGAVAQAQRSLEAGVLPDAGANDFASQSVMAVVAEVDVNKVVFAHDAGRRTLAVVGVTGKFK